MAPTPPTVLSLKQSFLTTQTRLLSQPLTPTRAWLSSNNNSNTNNKTQDEEALPSKALDDALFKLNHRLQQHARRAYAPQATRHVAEQIDQLYWNAAAERDGEEDGEDENGGEGLELGADLADPKVIATLPLEWEDPSSSSSSQPLEAKRYAELAGELHALAEGKQQATARVARLRRMQALLEPFSANPSDGNGDGDGDGALGGVQENLVTRNGEVEAELHRMRMLLARVGGRVGQLKEEGQQARESSAGSLFSDRGGGVDDVEMDEQRKVGLLLERF
ncbi:kinetochore Sim4 complex subunit Fta4 [Parachaetomium inaequale]|uniref:Kinetochore Sim4 complex subunit Fta4 n=1 Tax=Parachaetomium inaequale TaxID=2588326 RepID=A0AAN6SN41_9PEZI|nr:kinetochore Sim4 complex subunit Fta4 [Parachaetomium inaequale]